MQKEFQEIKEHIGKICASLERSQEALGSIKVEIDNITEIIYQAWLKEQK